MNLDYIRRTYDVEAHLGARVRYTGEKQPQLGTIQGAQGAHVLIKLDGQREAMPYHPTWELEYLRPEAATS
jgi:hypothetical protein